MDGDIKDEPEKKNIEKDEPEKKKTKKDESEVIPKWAKKLMEKVEKLENQPIGKQPQEVKIPKPPERKLDEPQDEPLNEPQGEPQERVKKKSFLKWLW